MALLLVGALGLLAPSPARADAFVTPFIGATFGADAPASEPTYGFALGGMLGGVFGIEGEFGYTPNFFASTGDTSDSHVLTLMGNVLVGLPIGGFRPYLTAGAGLIRQHNEFTVQDILTDISSNDFGINAGGGARFMFTDHVGVRADLRYFMVRKSGGLDFWRGYGGLNLAW
jgi:opacity protein-like surface antigen